MQDYINSDWIGILAENDLQSFDDWWNKKAEWFEPPNQRQGGWSGVSRIELGDCVVFLKRQENHVIRTLLHPFKGIPTFTREMENIICFTKAEIPSLTPVYFAQRNINGALRAILVTESLESFVSLSTISPNELSMTVRITLIKKIAKVIRQLHQHRIVHNCLYPKHLFVKDGESGFVVRLIDLEKARKRFRKYSAVFRDLDTLNRHCDTWTLSDRCRFLKAYLGETGSWRQLWRDLARRNEQRMNRHQKVE